MWIRICESSANCVLDSGESRCESDFNGESRGIRLKDSANTKHESNKYIRDSSLISPHIYNHIRLIFR